MLYGILADLVLVVHLGFVAFALLGALLVLRWRWLAWVHVPAIAWGALVEFTGWICPLTPLENWLRNAGGRPAYPSSFLEHHIFPVLYSSTLSRNDQIVLGVGLLVVNLVLYGFVFHRARRPRALPDKLLQPTRGSAPSDELRPRVTGRRGRPPASAPRG
jgi:hypothetical protein